MKRLNVLLVEDEELARQRLARLVRERADVELAAVCRNCDEAAEVMEAQPIDLALLDIRMPGTDGVRFSRSLRRQGDLPHVIFVTAHRDFACDAFELEAVDYLLKPFDRARLYRALDLVLARMRAREAMSLVEKIRDTVGMPMPARADASPVPSRPEAADAERILVRSRGRLLPIPSREIDWIEADGHDLVLHVGKHVYGIDGPLHELATRLGETRFVLVGRGRLVNIEHIAQLHEMFKGDLVAQLRNGGEVPISRRFRKTVIQRLAH